MSEAVVKKIKRLLGKLSSIDELDQVEKSVGSRKDSIKKSERLKKEIKMTALIRILSPGDVVVACESIDRLCEKGDLLIVDRVFPRRKEIIATRRRFVKSGPYILKRKYALDSLIVMDIRRDPPQEIAEIALRNRIGTEL